MEVNNKMNAITLHHGKAAKNTIIRYWMKYGIENLSFLIKLF